jgi:two-component SAPR family response regulator
MKVMLVDDDKAMLIAMRRLLSQIGGVTWTGSFQSGADALEWISSGEADLALVDIQMNGEDGIALAKKMKAVRRRLKIVFVTSHRDFALDAFELGAFDYIVKPVTLERLQQTFHRIAEESESAASGETAACLKVNVLGSMTASSGRGDVKWMSSKSAELFAYLLMHRDKGAARDRILDDLFDGMHRRNAEVYLNTVVYQLRKTLKLHGLDHAVSSLNDRYKLQPDAVRADVMEFEDGVAAIGEVNESNYKQAVALDKLYAGDLFGEKAYLWAHGEKERLSFLYTAFARRLCKWLLEYGHVDLAASVAKKLVARNETDEEANALLLRVYAAAKDRHSLMKHYRAFVALLREEYDTHPGDGIVKLYESLLTGQGEK